MSVVSLRAAYSTMAERQPQLAPYRHMHEKAVCYICVAYVRPLVADLEVLSWLTGIFEINIQPQFVSFIFTGRTSVAGPNACILAVICNI